MTLTDPPAAAIEVPAHEADTDRPDRATFDAIVGRLSEQSLHKRFDAYLDVPWDDPDYAIAADDPRWELPAALGGLGATDWYRSLPPARRAEIGLYTVAASTKVGRQFEGVLKRGMLGFASTLDDGDPVYRYVYHEVIEEAQHSLMFQEFVNRSGQPVPGLPLPIRLITHGIVQLGHLFPELFFLFVLGGEEPVDRLQRDSLRHADQRHPLLNRINQIHVTEEARHLSFAVHYLRRRSSEIGPVRRRVLAAFAPYLLGVMARLMLQPSPAMVRRFDIPRAVLREAYRHDPAFQQRKRDAVRRIRKLCRDLGIISPVDRLVWKAFGIWADD